MNMTPKVNTKPKYKQLKSLLMDKIDTEFNPGDKFYTQRKIMQEFKLGYSTVEKALNLLVESGILTRKQGSGTFVNSGFLPKVKTIAVIVYHMDNPFYSRIIKAAEQTARQNGYHLIVCNTLGNEDAEINYVNELTKENKVSGFLICPKNKRLNSDIFTFIQNRKIPCVLFPVVDTQAALLFDYVITNEKKGAYLATLHLLKQGCRKIAFVSNDTEKDISTANRLAGYLNALKELNVPFDKTLWIKSRNIEEGGGEDAADFMLKRNIAPDGIFAMTDLIAIGIIRKLRNNNLKAGKDFRIVGFDNIDMASWPEFSLTTINQPRIEIGNAAAKILIDRCNCVTPINNQMVLEPELIIRNTSIKRLIFK